MYLPPLEPIANADIRVSGDVKIHPSAVLAPGTILQAAPNSKIVIGADVCIGMGTIVNAYQGLVEIESGVILGAGVLIIGNCQIGRNACIGSATTIFNASVEAMTVVLSGSLIGDNSRSIRLDDLELNNFQQIENGQNGQNGRHAENSQEETKTQENSSTNAETETLSSEVDEQESFWFTEEETATPEVATKEAEANHLVEENQENDNGSIADNTNSQPLNKPENKNSDRSQVYINQLLITLFPHGRSLYRDLPKDSQSS
jgi:carbon dioxide concentrating mechanism protein CcmN